MRARRLSVVILLSAIGLTGGAWEAARHWPARDSGANESSSALELRGVLSADGAVAIGTPILELDIPVSSWVKKGQVIGFGESDGSPDAGAVAQARLRVTEAEAAVEEARQNLAAGDDVPAGPATEARQTVAAQAAALESEYAVEDGERLYRVGLESDLERDRVLARNAAASRRLEQEDQPADSVAAPEAAAKPAGARAALRAAIERRRLAQEALVRVANDGGALPVTAPADGYLVQSAASDDAFEIVPDLRRKVQTSIPRAQLEAVRVGQRATVTIDGQPGTVFQAVVESVGQPQGGPAQDGVVPVTLVMTDSGGIGPESTLVSVTLQRAGR